MSFLRISLLFFTASLLFFSVQSTRISSLLWDAEHQDNADTLVDSCNQKAADFSNFMSTMNRSDFGNMSIGNLTVFYEMCLDYTNCVDDIPLPPLARLFIKFTSGLTRLLCSLLEFKVGPFNQCLAKIGFDVKTLRNTVIGQETPNCELTDEEFGDLEAMVGQLCDEEAWDDMAKNKYEVRRILC